MKALLLFITIAFVTTFLGGLVPLINERWSKKHLWRLLAFGSGVVLGIAFLHLLPEGMELGGRATSLALLATFAALFLAENVTMVHACEDFLNPAPSAVVSVSTLIALSVHAFVDGMAIGVALRFNLFLGSVVSMGVILHKFADGLTLSSLLRASGYGVRQGLTLGALLALTTPAGAVLSFLGAGQLPETAIGIVLGITAGSFIYVGAADLLPRLHQAHDRYSLVFFVLGIIAVGSFLP